jgi:hypothetical protein
LVWHLSEHVVACGGSLAARYYLLARRTLDVNKNGSDLLRAFATFQAGDSGVVVTLEERRLFLNQVIGLGQEPCKRQSVCYGQAKIKHDTGEDHHVTVRKCNATVLFHGTTTARLKCD